MGLFDVVNGAGYVARRTASTAASTTGSASVLAARTFLKTQLTKYHRLGVMVQEPVPDEPTLFIGNHGFGGSSDVHVYAAVAIIEQLTNMPVKILAHKVLWELGLGPAIEALGAVQASPEAARKAFDEGYHVFVIPGGDLDASKPWPIRNTMSFHGHAGFVRLARNLKVPIVPIVTAGGSESAIVFTRGKGLAKAVGADKRARLQIMPVILSAPWGLNVLTSVILPYMPMPTKLDSVVMPARNVVDDDRPFKEISDEIEAAMKNVMKGLTEGRIPVIGRLGNENGAMPITATARPKTPKPPARKVSEAPGSGSSAPEAHEAPEGSESSES